MKQERIRLEKIHKYIDFYDSKTGKKSSKNETEFEFETTFNYDIDLEIRKELMYKPFKKIKKLEILNCRNREKNFTTFLFAAPFAENFIIGGAENDIPVSKTFYDIDHVTILIQFEMHLFQVAFIKIAFF